MQIIEHTDVAMKKPIGYSNYSKWHSFAFTHSYIVKLFIVTSSKSK